MGVPDPFCVESGQRLSVTVPPLHLALLLREEAVQGHFGSEYSEQSSFFSVQKSASPE